MHHVIEQRRARWRQSVRVVDDQHDIERKLGQFGEPRRREIEGAGGRVRAFGDQATERGARATGAHGVDERAQKAPGVVALVGEQPRDGRGARQELPPPLREQRRLAVSRARLHEHDLAGRARHARGVEARARKQA